MSSTKISIDEGFCCSPMGDVENLPGDDSFYEKDFQEIEIEIEKEKEKEFSLLAMVKTTMGENFDWLKRNFPYDPVYMEDTVASLLKKENEQQSRINSDYMRKMLQLNAKLKANNTKRDVCAVTPKTINGHCRGLAIHWGFCVMEELGVIGFYDNNIIFKAVLMFDMYCTSMAFHKGHPSYLDRDNLQLVICACLELAITMDEGKGNPYDTVYGKLCYWADRSFNKKQLHDMSWKVSEALDYKLEIANEYDFIDLFIIVYIKDIKQRPEAFREIKAGAMTCLYMMMVKDVFIGFPPSVKVMAAIAYTNIRLSEEPLSSDMIKWYKQNAEKPSFSVLILVCVDKLHECYDRMMQYVGECGTTIIELMKNSFDKGINRIEACMAPGTLTQETYNQRKHNLLRVLLH